MATRSGRKAAVREDAMLAAGGFALVLRRLRWPVALLWIAGIAALLPAANGLARATDDPAQASLPASSQSAAVAVQQEAEQVSGAPVSAQAIAVFARPGGLTPGDLAAVAAARAAVGALVGPVRGLGSPGPV